MRGAASVYRYGIDNLITAMIDPSDLLEVFRNVDRVRAAGVDEVHRVGARPQGDHR